MIPTTFVVVGGFLIGAEATGPASLIIHEMRESTWWLPLTTKLGMEPVMVLTVGAALGIAALHLAHRFRRASRH